MDTLQVIALIIVALIILSVIIAFRQQIILTLEGWGFKLNLKARNKSDGPQPPPAQPKASGPAGVQVYDAESTKGGLLVEEGLSDDGPGVDIQRVKTQDDIIIGKGQSGTSPKEEPPA